MAAAKRAAHGGAAAARVRPGRERGPFKRKSGLLDLAHAGQGARARWVRRAGGPGRA